MLINKLICVLTLCVFMQIANSQLVIGTQPVDTTLLEGDSLAMGIAATGNGTLTYQWQDSTDGNTWQNIASATTDTLIIDTVKTADSGRYLRVNVTDLDSSHLSNEVLLSVNNKDSVPVVDADPTDSTVEEGQAVSFRVDFTSINTSIQWQKDSLGTDAWVNIVGATDTSFPIGVTTLIDNASKYRAILTTNGGMDTSAAATLTVTARPPFADWTGNISFQLSTETDWANVTTDVINFPAVIRLDSNDFDFALAKANGEDIRFADANDNSLPYEFEIWDSTNKTAVIWVLIDTVKASSSMNIKMYYGNAAATAASNPAAVFDTTDGFAGVWHLNENGNVQTGGFKDATVNMNHCTGLSFSDQTDTAGVMGNGQNLNGTNQSLTCGTDSSLDMTTNVTICAWVNSERTSGSWAGIVSKDRGSQTGYWLMDNPGGTHYLWEFYGTDWHKVQIPKVANTWEYACGTYDGANLISYKNGVQANTAAVTAAIPSAGDSAFIIGDTPGWGTGGPFQGTLDEIQVSNIPRSAQFIDLSYKNQKPDQMFISNAITAGCTKAFSVSKDTVIMTERSSDTIVGTSTCALRSEWLAQDSSILTSGDQAIVSTARVGADSSFEVIYKAIFDTGVSYQNVVVNVVKNIPDPIPSVIAPTATWDGTSSLQIQSTITNSAAVAASPDPTISYQWTRIGAFFPVSFSGSTTGTVTLSNPGNDGTLNIELCANNGGLILCDTVAVTILRPVGVNDRVEFLEPLLILDGSLHWNRAAQIKIWTMDGKVVFERMGDAGESYKLSPGLQRLLIRNQHYMEINEY